MPRQLAASFNFRGGDAAAGKQPHYISARDGSVLSLARLWGEWHNIETGDPVKSCTIIATAANDLTRKIHDRMTVIVAADDLEAWLSGSNFSDRRI